MTDWIEIDDNPISWSHINETLFLAPEYASADTLLISREKYLNLFFAVHPSVYMLWRGPLRQGLTINGFREVRK